jgi:membrane protein YdbS with pleckstrin-like domain
LPAETAWDGPRGWQPLPKRAYRVFVYVALLVAAIPATMATLVLDDALARRDWGWIAIAAMWVAALGFALWIAHKRYRYTFWILDEDGFAVRRGRLWQWETRVPSSRVQHLDLKRGPLERAHKLASLVLHTAGTRLSAVSISGLDDADAERLRDHFSRQIDRQADDDHA